MDIMPAEHKTSRSSDLGLLGGARSVIAQAYLGAPCGLSTSLPQRPRLFKRTGVAHRSPPPPPRLAPIASPDACLPEQHQSASESVPHTPKSNRFNDEDEMLHSFWPTASGELTGSRPAPAMSPSPCEGPLPAVGGRGFAACATSRNSAPPSTHVGSLERRKMPPAGTQHPHAAHGYCHVASEGMSAEDAVCSLAGAPSSWCAAQTTAAVPRTQGVKGTRRNFKVTTAHAPTTSAAHGSFEDKVDAAHGASSCSRGGDDAVSCVASSIHMTVGGAPEEAVTATPLAAQSELADEAAAVQRIVFEESVDTAAVVTPAELQRMRVEAAVGGAQPGALGKLPTPYETRLITAEVLRDWTGWEDLDLVYSTQLRVDADMMIGVDQIGAQLPRLASLKLNCSRIPRVRQLGTGYHELKYLWLNSCHVTDLGGIAACCPSLVELYLPFNHVCDLAPVMALCETLEVLDVEGNLLDDIADLRSVLSSLRKVRSLSLVGNPLTYQHQARVREAYRDLLAEEGRGAGESTATTGGIDSPVLLLAEQRPFSHVLAAFVRLLMPQLQTLDDVDIDAIIAANPFAPSPVPGSPSEVANQRRTAPFSVHVDPLSDGLAEELRLVEECIRNTDAFDPLLAAVDEANRRVYTRPSTSGSGARPRHAPRTAMGLARPSTSQWRGAPTRLCSWGVSTMEASTLTTGATLAGNATASLRRRLPESTTEALDEAHDTPSPTVPSTGNGDGSTRLNGFSHRDHSCCSASAITTPTSALGGGARIAALLADDSEEEEWEHFKSSLLRSQSAATPSYSKFLHSQYEETGEAADTQQTDDFDKELRMELTRLRMRIAKEHRE